jgi:hypothetical protein
MAKTRLYLVAILGGALSGGSLARGDNFGQQTVALGQVEGNQLRQVRTDAEFRTLLRADRAVLFLWSGYSVYRERSLALLRDWVRLSQPSFDVGYVELSIATQPYAVHWLNKNELWSHLIMAKGGAVLWLRRGDIVDGETIKARVGQSQLQRWTEKAFGRRP